MTIRKTLCALLAACVPCGAALAEAPRTIPAESCDRHAVQKAIDAARDGDTVTVPAGAASWTTDSPTLPAVRINSKTVTLQGAGVDKTVITDATGVAWKDLLVWIDGPKPSRVTGFTFKGLPERNRGAAAVAVHGDCRGWRVDHCKFDASPRGVWAYAGCFGLVDNCEFLNAGQGVVVKGDGPASWARPLKLGLAEAVYIEDCKFVGGLSVTDGYHGARFVFRHNTVLDSHVGQHGCDSGGYRSTFSVEVYDNVIENRTRASGVPRAMHFRGGTGVVFNNTLKGFAEGIDVANYRSSSDETLRRLCAHWGPADGNNPNDGNEERNGYPAQDQIGRATNQVLEPLYQWNNTLNGKGARVHVSTGAQHVKAGRDFLDDTPRPGYKPYAYPHPLREQRPAQPPTDRQPPPAPTGLATRAVADRQVELTWQLPAAGGEAAGYYVHLSGAPVTAVTDPACTRYTFLRLPKPLASYTFAVSAWDAAGNEGPASAPVKVAPDRQPGGR